MYKILALSCLVLGGLCCPTAYAQSRQVLLDASARAFFNQGLELADAQRYQDAADRFRRALAIHDSPVIAYNLASVLDMSGEVVEALELLFGVEANEEASVALRDTARQLRATVEPKLSFLTVLYPAQRGVVLLDEMRLELAQIGVPLPVDPGEHSLRWALSPRHRFKQRHVVNRPGEALEVSLELHPGAVSEDGEHGGLQEGWLERRVPARDSLGGELIRSHWFWAGLGVVMLSAVTTASVLALSGT